MSEYDEVSTDDMALVAYLKLKGHTPASVGWDPDTRVCHWKFTSMAVSDASDFLEDNALVNPRDYTKYFGQAKREMFRAEELSRSQG